MKTDGLKKNMIFQFGYQFIILIIPLVLAPYLTRTLGETQLGIYAYTNSIAYYFVIFCMLGIVKHGQRVIASRKDDEIRLRKTFWSLLFLHVVVSTIGLLAYIAFCILICKDGNVIIYYAQGIYVLSAMFDVTWFFYGIERFKTVVIRNAIVKIIELLLILLLVKNKDDLLIYTLIMTVSLMISQFILIPALLKYVKPIKFTMIDVKDHVKPLLILSVAVVAVSLYTVFDKTLLGLLATKESVAYYEYSNKIISIPKTFMAVIGTVLFPRACNCIANNDFESAKRYYKYSLNVNYFIGFGSVFALFGIADLFSLIYFGSSFLVCGNVIKSLSPIILIIGIGDIFRMQFLIPMKKDIQYTTCIIINAFINLLISTILIPRIGIYGAVVGTLCAEVFGLVFQGILVCRYIDTKYLLMNMCPYIISAIIMLTCLNCVKVIANNTFYDLCLQIIVGGLSYIVAVAVWFLVLSKDKLEYRNKLKRVMSHKK